MIPIFAVCISALVAAIKIFGNKPKDENLPGKSIECIHTRKEIDKLQEQAKDNTENHNRLRELISDLKNQITRLEVDSKNTSKSVEDLKEDNREIVQRLDNLLKELMEWLNQ